MTFSYMIGLLTSTTVESAQPRNLAQLPQPLSFLEVGSKGLLLTARVRAD